jgi:hypothetical protein
MLEAEAKFAAKAKAVRVLNLWASGFHWPR